MRRREFASLLGGAVLTPRIVLPAHAEPPDGCGILVARDDGWPVASVGEDKLIDRGALCRMADRLASTGTYKSRCKLLFSRGHDLWDEENSRHNN